MQVRALFLAVIVAVALTSPVWADELPLWEAGFGVTGITLPDYRGSNEQREYALPLPYLVYRGEILRMDRKGLYGILFKSDRVYLNVSADGGVPVRSDRNQTRSGMPNLDPTFQIGPLLEICLKETCEGDVAVQVLLPVRAVFASDFSYLSSIGFVANPQLNLDVTHIGPGRGWNFGLAFGPLFATRQFHRYYYEVPADDAVAGIRPAYEAHGGGSGFLVITSLSKRFDTAWLGAFLRYDDLTHAVFADSPLVKVNHSLMAGIGLAWVFGQSPVLVHATP